MKKLVCGVGINNANYKIRVNGSFCPFYRAWSGMIKRCYSESSKKANPTYADCSVCEEWLTFSNFKNWMINQDWKGKHLDKDLLYYGNKIYSPDKCMFVEPLVNTILSTHKARKGKYPTGVNLHKASGLFQSRCSFMGKRKSLGLYETPGQAEAAYLKEKRKSLIKLASKQDNKVIKESLENIARLL